jgi:DNA-directed RNA polymerase II subunit RPB2
MDTGLRDLVNLDDSSRYSLFPSEKMFEIRFCVPIIIVRDIELQKPVIQVGLKINQEDSIIVNRSSIERGLFVVTSYRTLSYLEKKKVSAGSYESICLPPLDLRKKDNNYGLLDKNGIVKKGVPVRKGDVIIGKILVKTSKTAEDEKSDCSMTIKGSEEEGYVDRIIDCITPSGCRMIKIVIRNQRIPEVGDKLASRAAQKGTIGMVYRQEDMPFTQDGITPDLIINSHCIPSRIN